MTATPCGCLSMPGACLPGRAQVPWLASLPVLTWLGWPSASAWGWKLNTSLGYVGQVNPNCTPACWRAAAPAARASVRQSLSAVSHRCPAACGF